MVFAYFLPKQKVGKPLAAGATERYSFVRGEMGWVKSIGSLVTTVGDGILDSGRI